MNFIPLSRSNLKYAILLFRVCFMVAAPAWAVDYSGTCGFDTDGSKTYDRWCGGDDADLDGYANDVDCDDNNRFIFPGMSTGCNAGSGANSGWKTCGGDGTYTTCTANAATPLCEAIGTGNCYYISATGNDTTGDGSYANPWATGTNVSYHYDSNPANHVALSAGDVVYISGTITTAGNYYNGSRKDVITIYNRDGTTDAPIVIKGYPGSSALVDPGCSSASKCNGITWEVSDNLHVNSLAITNTYGDGVGGYSSANSRIETLDVYSAEMYAIYGGNGGITAHTLSGSTYIGNNRLFDVFDPAGTTSENSVALRIFSGAPEVAYNEISSTNRYSVCIQQKHAQYLSTLDLHNNLVHNCNYYGLGVAGRNIQVRYNLVTYSDAGLRYDDKGGTSFFGGIIEYNTFRLGGVGSGIEVTPHRSYNSSNTTVTACTGEAPETITIRYNITEIPAASFATETGYYNIGYYENDVLLNDFASAYSMSNNCFYNPSSSAFRLEYHTANNGSTGCSGYGSAGQAYTSLATWQAAGRDSASIVENPLFDDDSVATSTGCGGFGYSMGWATSSGGSSGAGAVANPAEFKVFTDGQLFICELNPRG